MNIKGNITGPGSDIIDNTTEGSIPVKQGNSFVDSPMSWSGTEGDNVVSIETMEVPPGTFQIGEGLKMSAAGVVPIYRSSLTGITYMPCLNSFDTSGSDRPFWFELEAEQNDIVQPDFSQPVPLSGMFEIVVSDTSIINCIILRCTPNDVVDGMRIRISSQTTGNPIYYYPSKAKWNKGEGEDIQVGPDGRFVLDISNAPLALLAGETLEIDYNIDSGDLFGDGTVPYVEVCEQVANFVYLVEEAPIDGNQYARKDEGWEVVAASGGDMTKAIYDPTLVEADAFSMGNMVETGTEKILTDAERTAIGTNSTHSGLTSGNPHNVLATEISDFDTEVSNNPDVTANSAKVSFPEAPQDGKQYTRKDAGWEEVVGVVDISCKLTNTTDQNIPNNSLQMVMWDTEEYDTDDMHSSGSVITIKTAGKYQITAQGCWDDSDDGSRFIAIFVNGGRVATNRRKADGLSEDSVTYAGDFAINDTIQLQVYQDSGGTRKFANASGTTKPYLEAHKTS